MGDGERGVVRTSVRVQLPPGSYESFYERTKKTEETNV